MKVFVSWSGERSRALAEAMRDWLPDVLHYVEPWLSATDIHAGERWATEVAKELAASNFGLLCLTDDNLTAPWVLFEAGALAKLLDKSRVVPLLHGVDPKDLPAPLSQFQAKRAEKVSLLDVVRSIDQLSTRPLDNDRLRRLFENSWSSMRDRLAAVPSRSSESSSPSTHELLKEIGIAVRALDQRLHDIELELFYWGGNAEAVRPAKELEKLLSKGAFHQAKALVRDGLLMEAAKVVRGAAKISALEAKHLVNTWQEGTQAK